MRHFCMYRRPRPAYAFCSTTQHTTRRGYETRGFGGHHSRGGDFGVRRPLRYLRYHLDLDESQSRRMAAVLNRLKLDREQAQLDEKRSVQAVAALLVEQDLQVEELKVALSQRVKSAEHLQNEVARALVEVRELLDQDQCAQFADLLATGAITL